MVKKSSSEPYMLSPRGEVGGSFSNNTTAAAVATTVKKKKNNNFNTKNAWNPEIESFLKNIGEQAAGYQWMHEKSAAFFGTISKLVTLGIVILGAIIAFILTSTLFSQLESPYILIPVGVANVLEIIMTILVGVLKTFGLENRKSRHDSRMNNFASLYNHIRRELSYYPKDRKYGPHFLSLSEQRFAFYKIAGPDIPGFIEWRYRRVLRRERSRLAKVGQISKEITVRHNNSLAPDSPEAHAAVEATAAVETNTLFDKNNLLPPHCRIPVSSDSENGGDDQPQKSSTTNKNNNDDDDLENQNKHLRPAPRIEDPYNRFQIDRYFEL